MIGVGFGQSKIISKPTLICITVLRYLSDVWAIGRRPRATSRSERIAGLSSCAPAAERIPLVDLEFDPEVVTLVEPVA